METTEAATRSHALLSLLTALVQELHPGRPAPSVSMASRLEQDLGLDSLARVELLLRIEQRLGLTAVEDAALGVQTAGELLQVLGVAPSADWRETVAAVPSGADARPQPPTEARTFSEVLRWHAERTPQRHYVTFYSSDDQSETLTFVDLYRGAQRVAGALIERGVQPGQVIALMLPSGLDFFYAFYGILLAGAAPAPLYPPANRAQLEDHLRRQIGILDNAQAPILITVEAARTYARLLQSQCRSLRALCSPEELLAGEIVPPTPIDATALGLIQYTSGSTGQPKGVMLSHANLLANVRAMGEAAAADCDDVFVSWLPLYHDMGLIGACLGSLYYGMQLILMSPLSFIARPIRWLHALHKHRGTLSAAPNFAYQLCAARLAEADLEGLDLSHWRLAFNGAEPVHPQTLEAFYARFAATGLTRTALTPVYGLAENAVGLAFPPLQRGPRIDSVSRSLFAEEGIAQTCPDQQADVLRFVSGGRALPGHEIRIVDARDRVLPERRQGRLQFRGPSATAGYYRNSAATAALMHDNWRDSGDYAYLADGEVFITGRAKDLIIRAGRNIYPYELEQAVGALDGIRKNAVAVFASHAQHGPEQLVILAETRERQAQRRQQLHEQIEQLAVELIGGRPERVILAPPRTVLKTSSGKIRRVECRQLYEQGAFDAGTAYKLRYWRQRLHLATRALRVTFGRVAREMATWAYSVYAWSCFVLCGLPVALLLVLLPGRQLRHRIAHWGARAGLALAGIRVRRTGRRDLPRHEALVIVSNHASYLDAIILTATLELPLHFVAKRSLQRPVLGFLLHRLGTEFVARDDVRQSVDDAERVLDRVQRGDGVVFFPEATFTPAPGLRPFRLGAFKVAAESGAPVIPIALRGTREVLRGQSWHPRPGTVEVWLGAPVRASGQTLSDLVELRDTTRAAILEHCGEIDLSGQVSIALPDTTAL